MMSVMSIGNIIAPMTSAAKAATAAATFFAMIDAPRVETKGISEKDVDMERNITFKKVTFAYPSRPHVKVLDELDLTFETGKLTAIVGPSGSGKSTIVGLVERWYNLLPEPTSANKTASDEKNEDEKLDDPPIELGGEISIGDHSLDSLDLKWWRSQIGLVQQEPFIFNDTIFNNVANGLIGSRFENEDAAKKKELVEEACKEAFADEFITRLPLVSLSD
jgi:ATP-binding cassette subfamily B (MDR/TAP) protein 1